MLGFDKAYDCLNKAVSTMEGAAATCSPEQRDALVRSAYENLYLAVNQATLGYEISLPYDGQIAGGFLDRCKLEEGDFCAIVHQRYYLDGEYPLGFVGEDSGNPGETAEPVDEMAGVREAFGSWLARAKSFVFDAQVNAQMMIHSSYAKVDQNPTGSPVGQMYGW